MICSARSHSASLCFPHSGGLEECAFDFKIQFDVYEQQLNLIWKFNKTFRHIIKCSYGWAVCFIYYDGEKTSTNDKFNFSGVCVRVVEQNVQCLKLISLICSKEHNMHSIGFPDCIRCKHKFKSNRPHFKLKFSMD